MRPAEREPIDIQEMLAIPACEVADWTSLPAAPLVSVVMLTYQHEKWIGEAIAGVVAQRCPFDIELLIGEDCSPDGTLQLCREAQARHPQLIRLVHADRNVGMKRNMQRLRARARGRYLAFCEGDDAWTDPNKLATQVQLMESDASLTACFCKVARFACRPGEPPRFLGEIGPAKPQARWTLEELIAGGHEVFHLCGCMFRVGIVQLPRWFLAVPVGDKPQMLLHAAAGPVGSIDAVMATYRIHGSGLASGASRLRGLANRLAWQRRMVGHFGRPRGDRLAAELTAAALELIGAIASHRRRWPAGHRLLCRLARWTIRVRPRPWRQFMQATLGLHAAWLHSLIRHLHRRRKAMPSAGR